MSAACECQFADSSYLANTCSSSSTGSSTVASLSLFMYFVDIMIRSHCDLSRPCTRASDTDHGARSDNVFDFIVIGGGVAGSVVAGRLSERPDWRVLLLEAGPEEPTATSIPAFAMTAIGTELDWQFDTEPQQGACRSTGGVCRWPRGKMMGGTSAMSGMMYTRGHPGIYNDWGCSGWSYEEVLPYFIKAENNKNPDLVEGRYHGRTGPLTVQRFPARPPLVEDILKAAAEIGFRQGDLNGHNQTGFTVAQVMVDGGQRASTARMYVRANKHRENLVVRINSRVTRVVIDPMTKLAKAVEYIDKTGRSHRVTARKEIVLSAGAVGSPHLLMLSGVGPRDDLRRFNIPVVKDLPVGRNLHNHVATSIKFFINDVDMQTLTMSVVKMFLERREGPLACTGLTQVTGFVQSRYSSGGMPDIQIFFDGFNAACSETGKEGECSNSSAIHCGKRYITIRPTNIMPKSVGYLKLRSANPLDPPIIDPNYLSEPVDIKVLIDAVRLIGKLVRTKALAKWGIEMDPTPETGCEHVKFDTTLYWECVIREHTGPENHPGGTCRMGTVGDPRAVVDPQLRVHGVSNLRVMDAAVLPVMPNGNPVSTLVMVAEKGSDLIKATWSTTQH